jgi:hypothetical protein
MTAAPRTLVLTLPLLCAAFTQAQTNTPSLDVCNVRLTLGMSIDRVSQQLEFAGCKLFPVSAKNAEIELMVSHRENLTGSDQLINVVVGGVLFRSGSLAKIEGPIPTKPETDRELSASLYAIFRQHETEGNNRNCVLGTTEDAPLLDSETKAVSITCSLGDGMFRRTSIRWTTSERSQHQSHVGIYQEIWR